MTAAPIQLSLFQHLQQHFGTRLTPIFCTKVTLVHISHTLEDLVLREQIPALLFTGFQESSHWQKETKRYEALSNVVQQVCIFAGKQLPPESVASQLHITLAGDDPLRQEWFLCILSERFSIVLCGQDRLIKSDREEARQFATIWTFDPLIVNEVLDQLEGVIGHYRPERLAALRTSRARFPPTAPDAALMTVFTRELIRFEELLNAELLNSQSRYRAIVEDQVEMICRFTPDGRITFVNPAFARMAGYPRNDLISQSFFAGIHAEDVPMVTQRLALLDTINPAETLEWRSAHFGTTIHWQQWTIRAICGPNSNVIELQAVGRDVTDRRQAETQLQRANAELTARVEELQQRTSEINIITEFSELIQACRDVAEAGVVIARCARRLFPDASGAIGLLRGNGAVVETIAHWGKAPPGEPFFGSDDCWALRRGRMHLIDSQTDDLLCTQCRRNQQCGTLCVPMTARGEALGVLHMQWNLATPGQFSRAPRDLLGATQRLTVAVAEQTAMALANLSLRDTLRQQAIRDPLTGLFNRRYLEETLGRELERAARHRASLGVLMIDLDHFKQFNDTYGHGAGDAILREIGGVLRTNIRAGDIACRYGGEEFVLILPDSSLASSLDQAERCAALVKTLNVVHHGQALGPITLSIGVAAFPDHGATAERLLRIADKAMYSAKIAGRDRIEVAA